MKAVRRILFKMERALDTPQLLILQILLYRKKQLYFVGKIQSNQIGIIVNMMKGKMKMERGRKRRKGCKRETGRGTRGGEKRKNGKCGGTSRGNVIQ